MRKLLALLLVLCSCGGPPPQKGFIVKQFELDSTTTVLIIGHTHLNEIYYTYCLPNTIKQQVAVEVEYDLTQCTNDLIELKKQKDKLRKLDLTPQTY